MATVSSPMASPTPSTKSASDEYVSLTHVEHVELRPDNYIGRVQPETRNEYVVKDGSMVLEEVTFSPGLLKTIVEILTNAADNRFRGTTRVDVWLRDDGTLVVKNNGKTIPVVKHSKNGGYIPAAVFGKLLTGRNYDDSKERIVGGRNGYGAKLANILSTRFHVECLDSVNHARFKKTWTNHMRESTKTSVTKDRAKNSYTLVEFSPDFAFFSSQPNEDYRKMVKRCVYDIAGTTPRDVRVYFNDSIVPIVSFKAYTNMFCPGKSVHIQLNSRWEVAVFPTNPEEDIRVPSYVNCMYTKRGGEHVKVMESVVHSWFRQEVAKKCKGIKVRLTDVRPHVHVMVNALVANPSFDSQAKECLATLPKDFGPQEYFPRWTTLHKKALGRCKVIDTIVDYVARRTQTKMANTSAKKKRLNGIPKLDDANKAGGADSLHCTLILTEGDSAKTMAIAGLSVVGRDHYGVFPLKGKLLNVRDASLAQRSKNAEIVNLGKILGVTGVQPQDVSKLRYGSVMIMADQDVDGSHIKGLVINWLDVYAPSLLRRPGFIKVFQTPIVRCTKRQQTREFFSVPEYEQWKQQTPDHPSWKQKYFKGLGTSTAADSKRYFSQLNKYVIPYLYMQGQEESIDKAFRRARAADRRQWLSNPANDAGLVTPRNATEFVDKELVLFGLASVARAVPSVWDGLKPSQRKVLFACLKRNLKDEIKVGQLSGYTSENTAYHHGEVSLNGTIIKMAQDFTGSNNIHLLKPNGQFGTRLMGGSDHASARYIFTQLTPDARKVFKEEDDGILHYLEEDGQNIEPKHYTPVLPWALVNGAHGIATGYSTHIPSFNPIQLAQTLRDWMQHPTAFSTRPLAPWVRGFTGRVEQVEGGFEFVGVVEKKGNTKAIITELPPGVWTQNYKDWLHKQPWFTRLEEKSTDTKVHLVVNTNKPLPTDLENHFKLRKKIVLNNLVLFDTQHKLKHYTDVYEILEEWAPARLNQYATRIQCQIATVQQDIDKSKRKEKWIQWMLENDVSSMDDVSITQQLQSIHLQAPYKDLFDMPIRSMTQESIRKLRAKQRELEGILALLQATTPKMAWMNDLQPFLGNKRKRDTT